MQLASATAVDFVLWSPEQKSVTKHKVTARVLASDWTKNGQYLALGQFNGHVSIRDKNGVEKVRIERSAPVWTLKWNPLVDSAGEGDGHVLAVGDWNKTLSFYTLSGAQYQREVKLGYDPCCISFYDGGE